jgi:hypothetical protein
MPFFYQSQRNDKKGIPSLQNKNMENTLQTNWEPHSKPSLTSFFAPKQIQGQLSLEPELFSLL